MIQTVQHVKDYISKCWKQSRTPQYVCCIYLNQTIKYITHCILMTQKLSSFSVMIHFSALTSCVPPCPFRNCPCHHSRPKPALCHHLMPRSPARRSLACVQTCPVVRNRHLPCRQPAREPWLRPQPHLRSPSTGIQAGPQTRRAALKGTRLCFANASYQMTPPSGMWRKFMTSSDHCQVR